MKLRVLVLSLALLGFLMPTASANHAADPPGDCRFRGHTGPGGGWVVHDESIYHLTDGGNDWTGVNGGAFDDCVDGKAGADTMDGAGGGDNLWGGLGNDTIRGGAYGDAIIGEDGADLIRGEGGGDRLYGGTWDDELIGGDGADNLFGGGFCNETDHWGFDSFGDSFLGPRYDETNIPCGWGGADTLRGGEGDDWIWESNTDGNIATGDGYVDVVEGGAGFDICKVEAIDIVSGCEEVDIIPTG